MFVEITFYKETIGIPRLVWSFSKKGYRQYFFSWHFEVAKTSKLNLACASLNSMWIILSCLWTALMRAISKQIVQNHFKFKMGVLVISRRQLRKYWLYEYVLLDVGFQFWSRTEKDQKNTSFQWVGTRVKGVGPTI